MEKLHWHWPGTAYRVFIGSLHEKHWFWLGPEQLAQSGWEHLYTMKMYWLTPHVEAVLAKVLLTLTGLTVLSLMYA
jgi:hypothetical protein